MYTPPEITELDRLELNRRTDLVLVQREDSGRCALVLHDRDANQARADAPASVGGQYIARYTDAGIMYVARWLAHSTARRAFLRERREVEEDRASSAATPPAPAAAARASA